MKRGIFVTGIGTDVGKTVVSAVLAEALEADYWKPIQAGDLDHSDSGKVQHWISNTSTRIHPEAYRLRQPLSPHAAAAIDEVQIQLSGIRHPASGSFLVVEGAGGLMVPLNDKDCIIDLIQHLQLPVVLVSKHYLGSINHTLLSIEALQHRKIPIAGLIFNGDSNPATEQIIEQKMGQKALFTLPIMENINKESILQLATSIQLNVQTLLTAH